MNLGTLKLFSNTLQAIAVGYAGASLCFLHFRLKGQLLIAGSLLVLYWLLMSFVRIGSYGGGDFTPDGNLAELIDRAVLGRWRDGAVVDAGGTVVYASYYYYTWILSSINFVVTVMTGMFAGELLKSPLESLKKLKYLLLAGAGMVVAGWLWNFQLPVIKTIWTSSMVLVSSGYCFLLMALFYYLIDHKGYRKGLSWLKVIGMNSIVAYVISVEVGVFDFSCIGNSVFFGLEQFMGAAWYHFFLQCADIALIYGLLWWMYKKQIFLKA